MISGRIYRMICHILLSPHFPVLKDPWIPLWLWQSLHSLQPEILDKQSHLASILQVPFSSDHSSYGYPLWMKATLNLGGSGAFSEASASFPVWMQGLIRAQYLVSPLLLYSRHTPLILLDLPVHSFIIFKWSWGSTISLNIGYHFF